MIPPLPRAPLDSITIGGKMYAAEPLELDVWREFQRCGDDAHPIVKVGAVAALVEKLIGPEGKADLAARMLAGEIRATDIFDSVRATADTWPEMSAP